MSIVYEHDYLGKSIVSISLMISFIKSQISLARAKESDNRRQSVSCQNVIQIRFQLISHCRCLPESRLRLQPEKIA